MQEKKNCHQQPGFQHYLLEYIPIPCNRRSKNCYISVLCEKYNNGWSTYNFWIRNHVWLHRQSFSPFRSFHYYAWRSDWSNCISSSSRDFILFLVCLVTLVSSCLLFQKRELQVDAWMKLIIFVIFSILSWLLFQSVWITLLLIIPAILGMMTLLKNKE